MRNPGEWIAFAAHNAPTRWGYGLRDEATAYLDQINEGRVVNLYWAQPISDAEAEALHLEGRDDTFEIALELRRNNHGA